MATGRLAVGRSPAHYDGRGWGGVGLTGAELAEHVPLAAASRSAARSRLAAAPHRVGWER